MMDKPAVKPLRTVALDADLKNYISDMLKAPDPDSPVAREVRERILDMAEQGGNLYRFALDLRTYLEEKALDDREDWVYPVAGDLYLRALETNLGGVGPNFFRDHYLGLLGCFRLGHKLSRTIESPFYCVDLLIHRMVMLFLNRHQIDHDFESVLPQFIHLERPGYAARMEDFFLMAHQAIADGVSALLAPAARHEHKDFVAHLTHMKECQEKALKALKELFHDLESQELGRLENVLELRSGLKSCKYWPLEAVLHEELGLIHEDAEKRGEALEADTEDSVHHFYEAADLWVAQGNMERTAKVFDLALRRHKRAIALFRRINDRTSAAKALVEKARTLIEEGIRGELVCEPLREAVKLVLACKHRLPQGKLPNLDDAAIHALLLDKGYRIEAEAFANGGTERHPR